MFHNAKTAYGGKGTGKLPKNSAETQEARYNKADLETPSEDKAENPKVKKQKPSLAALRSMTRK